MKFSEMIALRTDLARNLVAGFDSYLDDIAESYGAYLASALEEGEETPDVRLQLVLLRRNVERQRQRLERLDEEVVGQVQSDEKVRAEIEGLRDTVDGKLRLVRHACRGVYGADSLDRLGLVGEFPRGAARLHSHAKVVKSGLENPDLGLEPVLGLELRTPKGKTVPEQLVEKIDPDLRRLGELVQERHDESRKSTDARLQRQQVIREFDENIRGIVRMTQGRFRLAGRGDLGQRFQPILQRVLRKLKVAEAEEGAEAPADAADAAGTDGGDSAPIDDAAASPETTA